MSVVSKLELEKTNDSYEKTIEKSCSDLDLGRDGSRGDDSTDEGNNVCDNTWKLPSNTSSNDIGSGLRLSTSGQTAVALPEVIQDYLHPIDKELQTQVVQNRSRLCGLFGHKRDNCNLLTIVGPSSIKNADTLDSCSKWIKSLVTDNNNVTVAMRTNLSHPVDHNGSILSFEVNKGVPFCRKMLTKLAGVCPLVGEIADNLSPQYFGDFFSMALVSSTLVECQLHRELASGVSYPVGFGTLDSSLAFDKSMYKHKLTSALDSMYSSSQPHRFLSITKLGTVAVVGTTGNEDTFVVIQVNLELNVEELMDIISTIYNHPLNLGGARVLLDLGVLSHATYQEKLSIVTTLLTQSKSLIMGVLIDSGDDDYNEQNAGEYVQNAGKFIHELNSFSLK